MATKETLSERKSQLSAAKRALLERRLRGELPGRAETDVIPRLRRRGPAPLSYAQQRLWFLNQFDPGGCIYNLRHACRVSGALDPEALRKALDALVRRHESLRTNFSVRDGIPFQVIAESRPVKLSVIDLRGAPEPPGEAEIEELLRREARRPFDLEHDPLFRAALLRLDENEHVLLLVTHHITTDLQSNTILFRDLGALYEAFSTGRPPALPELPIQYVDFAVWQRERLTGEIVGEQLSYWKQLLRDCPPPLELPADRPRPAVRTFRGERLGTLLPKNLAEEMVGLGGRAGVSMYMTLLAAFQTLLHRYTGSDDVVVGSPIAHRARPETAEVVGFFLNMLVVRTDFSGDPTFLDLLGRVRERVLEAYAHQDLPFEKLVEELQLERSLGHHPLFNIVVNIPNASRPTLKLPGVTLSPLEFDMGTSKHDLTLFMEDLPDGLYAYVEYNEDLFEADTIRRMLGHFQTLLEAVADDPSRPVSELTILTAAEREQLLCEWNDTAAARGAERCVHGLFETQAGLTPEAVAVVCGAERLTFDELNRRSNQLAHYLRRLGVGPEVPVGISVERNVGMLVALLGVLKAGGAYVPLEPCHPRGRLSFMLADSGAAVVLTQARLSANLPPTSARIVLMDAEWGDIERESSDTPATGVTADNLAYIIYTSGSTGTPKGVAVEHRSVAGLLAGAGNIFDGGRPADVLASTSLSFDFSVFELFLPLTTGGKIIVAQNALELSTFTAAQGITMICGVPSAIAELVKMDAVPSSVETVVLGGEFAPQSLVRQVYLRRGVRQVFDIYGPTESTVCSVLALRTADGPETIGRPLAGEQVYILDENLRPMPVGVPGELHLGGAGLARGYLNRPGLTAERFIPHPFSDRPGARLYKTGDAARYRSGGDIEYRGRLDQQVKVRGFRIEPGEIEAALARHPDVTECVAVVREDLPGDKSLAAYVVARHESSPRAGELRQFLQSRLPEYMIPSTFVRLDALPLTPNGKIDRRSLPRPEKVRPELDEGYVAPRTLLEKTVADIWGALLGIDRVGVRDNFFELGGHSLLATQAISRLRALIPLDIPLRALFEHPTAESLAEAIGERRVAQVEDAEVARLLAEIEGLPEEDRRRILSDDLGLGKS